MWGKRGQWRLACADVGGRGGGGRRGGGGGGVGGRGGFHPLVSQEIMHLQGCRMGGGGGGVDSTPWYLKRYCTSKVAGGGEIGRDNV